MTVQRHRARGFFGGLLLGVGLALVLFVVGVIPTTVVWLVVLGLGLAVVGLVVASVVPGRSPAPAPGAGAAPAPPAP